MPRLHSFRRQRMRRRAESQDVEHQRLVVALPAPWQKSALGFPSVGDRRPAVLRPRPVDAAIERVGKTRISFPRCIRVEVGAAVNTPAKGWCCRPSTIRNATRAGRSAYRENDNKSRGSRWHPARALRAVPEEAQRGEHPLDRCRAGDEAALDRDRIAAKARPVAAMLAGQSGAVLSSTSPLCGLVSCRK